MINYTDNELVIKIKASAPAAMHATLMSAISASLRLMSLCMEDYTNEDPGNMAFLAAFLQDILPDERQLSCNS